MHIIITLRIMTLLTLLKYGSFTRQFSSCSSISIWSIIWDSLQITLSSTLSFIFIHDMFLTFYFQCFWSDIVVPPSWTLFSTSTESVNKQFHKIMFFLPLECLQWSPSTLRPFQTLPDHTYFLSSRKSSCSSVCIALSISLFGYTYLQA